MGAEITIDKHTTPVQEWFDVADKLQTISFDEDITPHVGAWKFFADQVNPQEFSCLPLELDLNSVHQIVSPHQTYLVYAIHNEREVVVRAHLAAIANLIQSIRQNIEAATFQVPMVQGSVEHYCYKVYAFFGKLAKSRIRMAALNYAFKMENLLNSRKKMSILSGGGVLRSKKLQKGSTLSILANAPAINKDIQDYANINIFQFFWKQERKVNPFLNFKSKRANAFIIHEEPVSTPAQKPAMGTMKPPFLKLNLEPFSQVTYADIQEQQKKGQINTDIRATARHQLKKQKFQGQCNEIIDGIFVSGQKVAKSWQLLQQHKIKAIINCAGDYCQNWFQGQGINYLTYFLKDSQNQNIECLFYRSIQFIQNCQKNKVNVLVHCIQGVSRSVTLVISYIIFKLGYDYKKAELFVKQRRGVACPNNGFMVELIQFHKRLYEDYNSLPNPRVFMVSSHSKETPSLITARMIKHPLFDSKKYVGLDSRGVYIVQAPDMVYIWVGSKCQQKKLQNYWTYAQDYVKKLQKYQRASIKLKAVSQGTEGKEFLALWNIKEVPATYQNPQYTKLFAEGQTSQPGALRKFYQRQSEDDEEQESQVKLYTHPVASQGLGVFQFQDLGQLSILAIIQGQNLKLFICRQDECSIQIGDFLDQVISTHYSNISEQNIIIEQQSVDNPSEELMSYFS